MKAKEFRTKSNEELNKILKDLKFQLAKSKSLFGQGQVKSSDKKKTGSFASKGQRTSLTKDIRKNIARIKTILNEKKEEQKQN